MEPEGAGKITKCLSPMSPKKKGVRPDAVPPLSNNGSISLRLTPVSPVGSNPDFLRSPFRPFPEVHQAFRRPAHPQGHGPGHGRVKCHHGIGEPAAHLRAPIPAHANSPISHGPNSVISPAPMVSKIPGGTSPPRMRPATSRQSASRAARG